MFKEYAMILMVTILVVQPIQTASTKKIVCTMSLESEQ